MNTRYRTMAQRMLCAAGALALSAALAAGGAAPAFAAEQAAQGDAGVTVQEDGNGLANGLDWTLDGGVLTISGNGAMEFTLDATYASARAPWIPDDHIGDYGYTDTTGITKVVIEEGVTSIPADAFRQIVSIKEVQLPSTLKDVGAQAFRDCQGLESVELPSSVESIGNGVFMGCTALEHAVLPSGATSLPGSLFSGCKSLTDVAIPEGVATIGRSAFSECTSLTAIELPDGLGAISAEMFAKCSKLASITIPASVTTIERSAFLKCTSLETVVFEGSSTKVTDGAFEGTPYLAAMGDFAIIDGVLQKYTGTTRAEVVIPSTVTKIAMSAFSQSGNVHPEIEKVVIPANVAEVGSFAFDKCENLVQVVMESETAPKMGYNAFGEARESLEIVIPAGAIGYLPGTAGYIPADELTSHDSSEWTYWYQYVDCTGTREQLDARKAARAEAREAAADVAEAIEALPSMKNLFLRDREAVEAAQAAFDALSEEGKKLVSSSLQDRLADATAQMKVIVAALDKEGTPIDEAHFPDYALRSVVLYDWDADRNEKLDAAEIANVGKINLPDGWRDSKDAPLHKVATLQGIELFTNLQELYVSNNEIASIDAKGLTRLATIDATGNKLARLDASAFEGLVNLYVADNRLTALDVSGNEDLTKLDAANNAITSIDLSNNLYLDELDLSGNQLVALDIDGMSLSYFKAAGQKRTVKASGTSLDMKSLDKRFDASKVSQLKGAKLSGSTLTGFGAGDVSYVYDCGDGQAMDVTLTIQVAKAQKLSGKASISKAMGAKPFALGMKSDVPGAKLSYKTSNKKVAVVSAAGKVTLKGAGTCKITVTVTADGYEKATKTVTVKATLAKAALAKGTKSAKKGKLTAAWKKVAGAQGYQLKVGKKTYTVKSLKKTVKAKSGKVKVQVRAYSKASGKTVYGKWSKAKTVKVK